MIAILARFYARTLIISNSVHFHGHPTTGDTCSRVLSTGVHNHLPTNRLSTNFPSSSPRKSSVAGGSLAAPWAPSPTTMVPMGTILSATTRYSRGRSPLSLPPRFSLNTKRHMRSLGQGHDTLHSDVRIARISISHSGLSGGILKLRGGMFTMRFTLSIRGCHKEGTLLIKFSPKAPSSEPSPTATRQRSSVGHAISRQQHSSSVLVSSSSSGTNEGGYANG